MPRTPKEAAEALRADLALSPGMPLRSAIQAAIRRVAGGAMILDCSTELDREIKRLRAQRTPDEETIRRLLAAFEFVRQARRELEQLIRDYYGFPVVS